MMIKNVSNVKVILVVILIYGLLYIIRLIFLKVEIGI